MALLFLLFTLLITAMYRRKFPPKFFTDIIIPDKLFAVRILANDFLGGLWKQKSHI
jgi:hypothetical protein